MRDLLGVIFPWDDPIALATVTATWGSAPRPLGSHMVFTASGRIAGSVSGGCVEAAVFEEGLDVLASGRPKLVRYGVADEAAFEVVGLACGGSIEVFVCVFGESMQRQRALAIEKDMATATATVIAGADETLGESAQVFDVKMSYLNCMPERASLLQDLAHAGMRKGRSVQIENLGAGIQKVFVDVQMPAPQLIIIGAVHIAQTLVVLAQALGFRVTLIDPRSAFASTERFPTVDQMIIAHPHEALQTLKISCSTALVTLTHDARFDEPALAAALRSDAFYIGALGGRTTSTRRRKHMESLGFGAHELERISGPVGMDIGARSPAEIALATMAEIVAARNVAPAGAWRK